MSHETEHERLWTETLADTSDTEVTGGSPSIEVPHGSPSIWNNGRKQSIDIGVLVADVSPDQATSLKNSGHPIATGLGDVQEDSPILQYDRH